MAFAWGAILGSFVNVVIHRVPRRESVVTHGSRCPACGAAIRPRDNIPVLGWLLLGGRCRDCGAAISAGYPTVEAGCGAMAAIIAIAELAGTGSPLLAATRPGIDRLLSGDWQIAMAWAVHTVIPVAMLAWSLTDCMARMVESRALAGGRVADGCHAAAPLVAAVIATVSAVPAVGPPGFLIDGGSPERLHGWQAAFVASCLGALAGRLAGAITALPGDRCGFAAFGAAAGWQAVVVAMVVTTAIRLPLARLRPQGVASRVAIAAAPAAVSVGVFAAWAFVARAWAECWHMLARG